MGSLFTALEPGRAFRSRALHTRATAGLLLDEHLTDCFDCNAADRRDTGVQEEGEASQAKLLAALIGGAGAHKAALHLISSLGSLGRVMAAPPGAIARLAGDEGVAQRIAAARQAVLAGQKEEVHRTVFDIRAESLQRYIVGLFQGLSVERLHAFFLDASHRFVDDASLVEGGGGQVTSSLRALVSRAIDLGAAGLALAHNHPSGFAEPSEDDIRETRRLSRSLAELDLALVDHLIVGGTTIHSMRRAGLL
jgi:DNA repair protein RadC